MTDSRDANDLPIQTWLQSFLAAQGGVAGTVHLREGETLTIAAAVNIPPKVREVTARIPRGKGMAGLAFDRNDAVTTCNLQDDAGGAVRPGAKAVDARAAAAIPVRDAKGEVRAIVGIAFSDERDLPAATLQSLTAAAQQLPA